MSDRGERDPDQQKLPRRAVLGFGIAATGGALFAARNRDRNTAQPPNSEDATRPSDNEEASVVAEVTDITIGSVHVTAPAGVAAPGTRVSISLPSISSPASFAEFGSEISQPVEIILGDHLQPNQPITISFNLAESELAADVSK